MKDFFRAVGKSCYDMEWYRGVRQRPWRAAFGYAVRFHAVVAAAAFVAFAAGAAVASSGPNGWGAGALAAHLRDKLPDGSTVAIHRGVFETNVPTPIDIGTADVPFVIDPSYSKDHAPDKIGAGQGVLVGRDAFFLQAGPSDIRTYSLAASPDFTITKTEALDWLQKYGTLALIVLAMLFALAYFAALLLSSLSFILFASSLALLVSRFTDVRLRFGQWFAVGCHAVTLPILVDAGSAILGFQIPFAFAFIAFMVMVAVAADERANPVAKKTA